MHSGLLLPPCDLLRGPRTPPIYKCPDNNGGVLYIDYPCEGGQRLEIQPGAADPAAVERLASLRAALDRSAARRKAEEDLQTLRTKELDRVRREAEDAQRAAENLARQDYVYPSGWGSYSLAPPWPPRHRIAKPMKSLRFVRSHSLHLPRR